MKDRSDYGNLISVIIIALVFWVFSVVMISNNLSDMRLQQERDHQYLVDIKFIAENTKAWVKTGDNVIREDLLFIQMQNDRMRENQFIIWEDNNRRLEIITENTRQKTFDEMTDDFDTFWEEAMEEVDE